VQELFAWMEPPVKVIVDAVVESVPLQVVAALPDTTTPLGKLSVRGALSVATVAPALVNVIVRVEMPPALMVAALKALPSVTAEGVETVKVATAGAALLPPMVCKAPAASELMKLPPAGALTSTVTVQELLLRIEPPVNVTAVPPALAAVVPPQVVPALGVEAITTPVGNVSISGAVKLSAVALALLKVMVRVETPPALIAAGLKALPRVGATGGAPHTEMEMTLESIVTAPFRARARPETLALVVIVMLVSARIFPMKLVLVPIVAELPTCQKTLQS